MSQRQHLNLSLTRRHWLLLAASGASSALTGCGGGSIGGGTAGLPGTGGTGTYALFSQGSISGFGSVIVNGIKFDDGLASVQMDGVATTSADLRLGMVAAVQGERGADITLGTASRIEVWSVAQGLVSQPGSSEFTVVGVTVQTDSATVFDGVSSAAQLAPGQRVAVWGLQAGADGRRWKATRVAVASATDVVSTGLISAAGSQPYLNGMLLTGSSVGSLVVGQLVRVQGILSATGSSLAVASIKVQGLDASALPTGEIEIEGLVTAIASATRFTLGSVEIDASTTTYSPLGAQVTLGARIEVYGTWQAGGLKATKVELEDEQTLHEVEIDARIEQFTSQADFVVRGQRCDATHATFSHGKASDLKVGVKVKVKGAKSGADVLMVVELEFD